MLSIKHILLLLICCEMNFIFAEDPAPYPDDFYGPTQPAPSASRPPMPWFGAAFRTTPPPSQLHVDRSGHQGVWVTRVYPNTTAARMGIQVDDLICDVNGRKVTGARTAGHAMGGLAPGETMLVTILRDGVEQRLSGTMRTRANSFIAGMTPDERMAHYRKMREELFFKRMQKHEQKQQNDKPGKSQSKFDPRHDDAHLADKKQASEKLVSSSALRDFTFKYRYQFDSEEL